MTMFSCSEQTDNVYEESYVIQHKLIQVMRTLKGNVGADLILTQANTINLSIGFRYFKFIRFKYTVLVFYSFSIFGILYWIIS